ncbi:MAG: trypsin-like peptidase domain-containing protein [Patescibacteria group bacterium]|nr:trypsin-like peptidase domain-containing protein [Patescibacteria group bacterium]MDE1940546.1 trypsin-like peptidase domain-containing protein [Patescibacteria group bacterium]MDE1966992.1 trypsin-like peptidase domain-containing protein [Patescibacteria group bacterium]
MKRITATLFGACFLIALGIGVFNLNQITVLERQLNQVQDSIGALAESQASTTARIGQTASQVAKLADRPGTAPAKSQDQLLTTAVADTAPAVVSVVISKDVPNLQVAYMNPFGSDPAFQGFGFQVPVWVQKGSTLQKIGAGTGFLISHDGYILTNRHVVEDVSASYTVLLSNGDQKPASVVYRDPNNDLAVIKIDGYYPTIASFGDSSSLKLGQTVVAIGNALGEYSNSVSVGIISGLNRTIQASDTNGSTESLDGVIQTDASINPGNSGGPLIDLAGHVVGVNVATVYGSSNISFAIPTKEIMRVIAGYI